MKKSFFKYGKIQITIHSSVGRAFDCGGFCRYQSINGSIPIDWKFLYDYISNINRIINFFRQ